MDPTRFFRSSNLVAGPVRFRLFRVKNKTCGIPNLTNFTCYERSYGGSTKSMLNNFK